jgi:hypothetical protein
MTALEIFLAGHDAYVRGDYAGCQLLQAYAIHLRDSTNSI